MEKKLKQINQMGKLLKTALTLEVCLELKNYLKDVWIENRNHGGLMHITFEKGEQVIIAYRLYSECKEAFKLFPAKIRVSAKSKKNN